MKRLFLIFSLLIAFSFVTDAQIKYPWGQPATISLTSANVTAGAIALASIYDNLTIYTVTSDTSVTINAATLNARLTTGARLIFIANDATASADTITWGSNLAGVSTKIASGKRYVIEFIYNGTSFYKVAETIQN